MARGHSPPPAPLVYSARCTLHAALLGLPTLADKGYHGAGIGVHTPAKGGRLAPSTACRNQLLTRLRAEGERGIALLKT